MIHIRLAAAVLLAASSLSPAAAQPASQTIQVYSYGFGPKPIHLAAGKPVTLMFVNQSGSSHDFTAPQFFASSNITAGSAPKGAIDLAAHQTVSITLVPRAGNYQAHCSHFLHASFGMTDQIVVN
jgi:plastocyanin